MSIRGVPGRTDHVVVVGAGFAGLAAALHLCGRGRQVTVVERHPWPGGRAGRQDIDGYRIDTGPTVLTMPDLIDEAFAAVGENLSQRLELLPLDPAYRAKFADGGGIDVYTDADRMAAAVREFAGPNRRPVTGACAIGSSGCTALSSTASSRPISTPRSACSTAGGEIACARRLPPLGDDGQTAHQRPTVAAGVHLPVALRRCRAARRAGGLCGDRLHGHRLGRVLPPRRRARVARRARGGRRRRRCAVQLRVHGHRAGTRRRADHRCPHRPGRANRLRRSGFDHRVAADLPVAGPVDPGGCCRCARRRRRW